MDCPHHRCKIKNTRSCMYKGFGNSNKKLVEKQMKQVLTKMIMALMRYIDTYFGRLARQKPDMARKVIKCFIFRWSLFLCWLCFYTLLACLNPTHTDDIAGYNRTKPSQNTSSILHRYHGLLSVKK